MHISPAGDKVSSAMHIDSIRATRVSGRREHPKCGVSDRPYRSSMAWTAEDRQRRFPEVQRGCDLLGAAVKRRRYAIHGSKRDLQRASGVHQSVISRLENGILPGIRFARLVAAMNGLDVERPHPPLPVRALWD